jgi:hypothetical protein
MFSTTSNTQVDSGGAYFGTPLDLLEAVTGVVGEITLNRDVKEKIWASSLSVLSDIPYPPGALGSLPGEMQHI